MGRRTTAANDVEPLALVGDIVRDAGKLFEQQIALARAEVRQELGKVGAGAASAAAGGGLAAAGGLMAGLMAVHLLHRTTGLPLWACYGAVAGGLGAAGAVLLREGRRRLGEVRPLPQTVAAARENVQWLKDQLTPATA